MMRIIIKAAFALVAGVMIQAANAEAAWQCTGPQAACVKDSGAKKATKHVSVTGKKAATASIKSKKTTHASKKSYTKTASKPAKAHKVAKSYNSDGGSSYQSGIASWYGGKFHGRQTASGETYNQNALTAAHRSLPFGTKVRVTNTSTGNSVVVRINDRGPFVGGRVIDLSRAAASSLGIGGLGHVKLAVLGKG